MTSKVILFFALLCGLGSTLFIPTPFGRAAMFDLVSYVLGPILFLINYRRYTRAERRLLLLAFLWFLGACYSNWWREEPFAVALKGNAIIFDVACMLFVTLFLAKKSYRTFLWFSVGYSIGMVISLYVFQNSSYLEYATNAGYSGSGGIQDYLVEKQIYPIYAQALFIGILFPLQTLGLVPWGAVILGCVSTAFTLLFKGGSRSGFGFYMLTGLMAMGYAYLRPMVRMLMRNFVLMTVVGGIVGLGVFGVYAKLALAGKLGEAEYNKYMVERDISEAGYLGSRDDLVRAWPFLKNHPFVGCGSSALDRWGYIEADTLIPGHSCLVAAWTQNGVFGLIFWIYALWLVINFMRKHLILFGDWFPFLAFQMVGMIWNFLFSPFGWYRGMACMTLAFCATVCSSKTRDRLTNEIMNLTRR